MEGRGVGFYDEQIKYGKAEQKRRKETPVLVRWDEVYPLLEGAKEAIYIVDPRLGFNNRTHRFWLNALPPGGEEGQQWKTLGHRHTVEAVIYWLEGAGYSIIDGIRYDWRAGDLICVPVFAWHRHINPTDQRVLYLACTSGPFSMALGQAVYEDERYPEYWVYAQEGEHALRTLIPGGAGERLELDERGSAALSAARLYAEEVAFAAEEEQRRRQGKVLVRADDLRFEPTALGSLAYAVDPRIGFNVRTISTLFAEIPAGSRSGAHRHLYDEIDHVLTGRGRAIISDQTYEVAKGDTLAIPVFAWHQYFNDGDEPLRILRHNTRPTVEGLGLSLTHHGEAAAH